MESLKKILTLLIVCAYVLGTIGGFGYALYGGSWPIAIAIVILGILAFPKFKEAFKELTN